MKRLIKYLITIICGFLLNCPIFADNTHILVFRHSGSIESYEISKVSSIELSEIDEKGNVYDTPVSQIFRIGEKSVVIPIEDIDSVSFGDRNCIVARKDARRILDSELQFISKYDGSELLYSSATPSSAIPNVGEKVYYDNFCDIFPFGLCAEIKSRTVTSEGYILHTEDINPDKVFEEFIVSGDFEYVPVEKSTRAELEAGFSHDTEFDFPPLRMESSIAGGLSFKNFIGCPRKNYYSADIYLNNNIELNYNIHSDDSGSFELESPSITVAKGVIAGVLYPQLDINLFCDIEAMLSLGMKLKRTSSLHYHWVKDHDKNSFELIDDGGNEADNESDTNTATLDLLLDGTVYLGAQADLSLNTLFNRAGAGIRAKIGPEFKGEFGMGMINEMEKEYDPIYFAKAKIFTALVAKTEAYLYHLENIITGKRVETPLPFNMEARFFELTINLLPEFQTRAVRVNGVSNPIIPSKPEKLIDIASITTDTIIRDVEIAFRLTDKSTGTTIDEAPLNESVSANSEEPQGFNTPIPYSGNIDEVEVKPIIRYADRNLLCESANPIEGAAVSNIFSSTVSTSGYGVGGAAIIGQKTTDQNTYIVGNIMPVATTSLNKIFRKKRSFKTISFIEEDGKPSNGSGFSIFGSWVGEHEFQQISLTLSNESNHSYYNGEKCEAIYNSPQSGIVTLKFDDDKELFMRIEEVGADFMTVYFRNSNEKITFKR